MNRDFQIGNRLQRPKTLDLRRKVLLKNFFRTQNIFVHSVTSSSPESFEFSTQGSSESDEVTNVNGENNSSLDVERSDVLVEEMEQQKSASASSDDPVRSDNMNQNIAAFSFTTMMVALPDSTSSTNSDSSTSNRSPNVDNSSESNTVESTTRRTDPTSPVKVKRKFSLKKPYSFSRRKSADIPKVTAGMKIFKSKSSSASIKSPKKKKNSFRSKLTEMFTSKSPAHGKSGKFHALNNAETDKQNTSYVSQSKCTFLDLTVKQAVEHASKSVSVQTEVSQSTDISVQQDLENKRLRLENKDLKGKLQFLLSLNMRDNWKDRHDVDVNDMLHSPDNSRGRKKFESNQENKTGFNSNCRLTRSRSVQANSRSSEPRDQWRSNHCRRARSICVPRDETYERNSFYNYRSSTHQPFKPMQSYFYNGQRKRKASPTNSERLDSKHSYRKRARSLSSSYDTPV